MTKTLGLTGTWAPRGRKGPARPHHSLAVPLLVVAAVTCVILPVGGRQLGPSVSFVPAMLALVCCFDVLSVVFLLREFLDTGERLPLRLSWAYVFSLVVMAGYAAAFPGVLGSTPPLALHPSTAPWLWVAWHGGFPVLLAMAMAARRAPVAVPVPRRLQLVATSLLACAAAGGLCVLVASWGGGHLPVIIHGHNTSAMTRVAGPVMLPVVCVATALAWRGARQRTGPERWAALAAATCLGDVVLTLTSQYRYSLGWYTGRTLTVFSAAAVLVGLLVEFSRVKSRLAKEGERLSVALRRADELERLQQNLLDHMVDGVTLRNPDGQLVASNSVAPRLLGVSPEQLAGSQPPGPGWRLRRADGALVGPEDDPGAETARTGVECHGEILAVELPEGASRWVTADTVIIKGTDGSLEGVVTTYADVTSSHGADVCRARELAACRERVERVLQGEDCLGMVYQPIVELLSSKVVGYEALSRFSSSPPRPPDQWFSDADAVGLGLELELYALKCALSEHRRLAPGTYFSLNVSPKTAMSPMLGELLAAERCEDLVLEVTEHVGVENYERLGEALGGLRDRGLRIAVDDAGSGYASLKHILSLRPDVIKLDIALTRGIDLDPARQALAVALVSFRKDVNAALVAEGIETAAELDALIRLGLQHGQGYYLGRPGRLPIEAITVDSGGAGASPA